jgi:hypothetical protein
MLPMADDQALLEAAANGAQKITASLINKRVRRMKEGQNPDRQPRGEPTHLAHYTTADGLRGIIQNGNLWATSVYYLNDSSEIEYGCQLLCEILTRAIAEESRDPVSKNIFEEARKAFEPSGEMERLIRRTYVACFCETDNLLSQWRTYGQSGGYAISFPLRDLRGGITISDHYHTGLHRVIYDRQAQTLLLQLVMDDVISVLNDESVRQLWKSYGPAERRMFSLSFNSFLRTLALNEIVRFKDPAFEEEREWRLAVRPMSVNLNDHELQYLKFRTARGMAVPYVELRSKYGTLLPITSVRYGPTLKQKQAVNSLSLLFKQKGYSSVKFKGADIPVII